MKFKNSLPSSAIICFLLILMVTVGCKKDKIPIPIPTPTPPPVTTGRADLTKDSIFLYAKQIYYWNDALPTYEVFNPRKYTSKSTDLGNYEDELFAITQIKINPFTGLPYEYYSSGSTVYSKYSYISDITNKNPIAFSKNELSAVDLEGNGNDLGIKLGAYANGNSSAFNLYITAVYQSSPADRAGLKRSDRISKINGTTIGSNFNSELNLINSLGTVNSATLDIVKTDGTTATVTLTKALYKSSPVYKFKTFTAGSKKIGYIAYARFSTPANSQPDFDLAFAKFAADGVADLIVDLRYNGGGYVTTAQNLINQIATPDLTGQVMFSETYNSLMQSNKATILSNQPLLDENGKVRYTNGRIATYADIDYSIKANTETFNKQGPLTTVSNIVFIVSGSTASASELVINSLKPYKNVKVVGVPTYGKPIGFFPVRVENRYDVFMSLFSTKNSLGQGEYYNGFTPDEEAPYDDPTHDFGDAAESRTAVALSLLAPKVVITGKTTTLAIGGEKMKVQSLPPAIPIVDGNEFNGMIKTNFKLK